MGHFAHVRQWQCGVGKRFYLTTRELHLYAGLFISPFVLLFAASVFFLVHSWLPRMTAGNSAASIRTVASLRLPPNLDKIESRERVVAVRSFLDQLGVVGEIGFIGHIPKEHRFEIPVFVPGRETTVDLDYHARTAIVSRRATGLAEAFVYLHKSPARTWPQFVATG